MGFPFPKLKYQNSKFFFRLRHREHSPGLEKSLCRYIDRSEMTQILISFENGIFSVDLFHRDQVTRRFFQKRYSCDRAVLKCHFDPTANNFIHCDIGPSFIQREIDRFCIAFHVGLVQVSILKPGRDRPAFDLIEKYAVRGRYDKSISFDQYIPDLSFPDRNKYRVTTELGGIHPQNRITVQDDQRIRFLISQRICPSVKIFPYDRHLMVSTEILSSITDQKTGSVPSRNNSSIGQKRVGNQFQGISLFVAPFQ